MPSPTSPRNPTAINDLITLIDTHLANHLSTSQPHDSPGRPSSRGTMFVDWNGYDSPKISYRHGRQKQNSSPRPHDHHAYKLQHPHPDSSPLLVSSADNLQLYRRRRRRDHRDHGEQDPSTSGDLYVHGSDPSTGFTYDYDGKIMHIHRSYSSSCSTISDYWAVDARTSAQAFASNSASQIRGRRGSEKIAIAGGDKGKVGVTMRVVDKELPRLPGRKKVLRESVVGFIRGVLGRLEGLGLLRVLGEGRIGHRGLVKRERVIGDAEGCKDLTGYQKISGDGSSEKHIHAQRQKRSPHKAPDRLEEQQKLRCRRRESLPSSLSKQQHRSHIDERFHRHHHPRRESHPSSSSKQQQQQKQPIGKKV